MMVPYLDSELGLHDPDDLGSWTPEDFVEYARNLLAQQQDKLSDAGYLALQNQLTEQYRRIVSSPRPINDEVIVPTNSLCIEALPGAHPLLEDFKLAHRAIDVDRARVEAEAAARKPAVRGTAAQCGIRGPGDRPQDPDQRRHTGRRGTA